MTLCTTVRIYDPAPLEPLWDFVRGLVGSTGATAWAERTAYYDEAITVRHNLPGQGCSALLSLRFSADGFLPADAEDGRERPCVYEVDFDTPYSAPTCGHFQAMAVTELTRWLDERGARWEWEDEYSGEWHGTLDAVGDRLGDPLLAL